MRRPPLDTPTHVTHVHLLLSDRRASADKSLPPILAVITGNGPKRRHYEAIIEGLQLQSVSIRTGYLNEYRDYAILLCMCTDPLAGICRACQRCREPMGGEGGGQGSF